MKRIQTLFLSLTIFLYSSAQFDEFDIPVPGTNQLARMVKTYFRSDPFSAHFSFFLHHLMNDPTLAGKTIIKKTDTTFFFFKGDYTAHNPFGFKANRTEIRLAEREVLLEDSVSTTDTLFFYQLLGYSYGKEGLESVKKEFSKFDRKYGKNLYSEDSEIKKGNEVVGTIRNYFVLALSSFSPFSASWAKLDDQQNVFTITIRIKLVQNTAVLPSPAGTR